MKLELADHFLGTNRDKNLSRETFVTTQHSRTRALKSATAGEKQPRKYDLHLLHGSERRADLTSTHGTTTPPRSIQLLLALVYNSGLRERQ